MSMRWSASLLLLSLFVPALNAQQGKLLVAQKGDRALAIVDPAAGKVIANVPEGGITGHEVIASPDGRFAYVPIYGNSGVGKPGTDGSNLVVIDIASQKVVGKVDFGHGVRPHMPIFGPKDGLLYVTTELDKSVTIIDPETLKIVGSIPTGQAESHMLAISAQRAHRLHRQCRSGHSLGARHAGAQDRQGHPHLRQHAAYFHLYKRPLGVYRRPDQPAPRRHRYREQPSRPVDSARGHRIRKRAYSRWPLAADRVARPEQGRRH